MMTRAIHETRSAKPEQWLRPGACPRQLSCPEGEYQAPNSKPQAGPGPGWLLRLWGGGIRPGGGTQKFRKRQTLQVQNLY